MFAWKGCVSAGKALAAEELLVWQSAELCARAHQRMSTENALGLVHLAKELLLESRMSRMVCDSLLDQAEDLEEQAAALPSEAPPRLRKAEWLADRAHERECIAAKEYIRAQPSWANQLPIDHDHRARALPLDRSGLLALREFRLEAVRAVM